MRLIQVLTAFVTCIHFQLTYANAGVMRATLRNAAGASDEVIYHFDNGYGYTHNRDLAFDVPKLQNTAVNVGSFSDDNVLLTADMRPVLTETKNIRMRVQGNATGAYTLTFTDLATGDWFLRDKKLNTLTSLNSSPAYAFNIDMADTTTFGNNRFELVGRPYVTLFYKSYYENTEYFYDTQTYTEIYRPDATLVWKGNITGKELVDLNLPSGVYYAKTQSGTHRFLKHSR